MSELHAYRPIPLLPMEVNRKQPPNVKSEYEIEILESETATEWMKQHRLPDFLNSDLFHFYRMGRLLSQASEIYRASGRTAVVYERKSPAKRPPIMRKSETHPKEKPVDPYVCYGSMPPTISTRTVVSGSNLATDTTFSSAYSTPRLSTVLSRPKSGRPSRGMSSFFSIMNVLHIRMFLEPMSRPGSSIGYHTGTPLSEITESGRYGADLQSGLSGTNDLGPIKSIIPIPAETICMAEEYPLGPLELKPDDEREEEPEISANELERTNSSRQRSPQQLVVADNEALAGLEKCKDPAIAQALIQSLRKTFEPKTESPEAMLSRYMLNPHFEKIINSFKDESQVHGLDIKTVIERAELLEQDDGEQESISGEVFNSENSDEVKATENISNFEIFSKFKSFIQSSSGWPLFNLWMDIDRLKTKEKSQNKYYPEVGRFLANMRQSYLRPGGELSLTHSVLTQLNLSEPDNWSLEFLSEVQPHIMQMLLSYWAIRFLVNENSNTKQFLENDKSYQKFKTEVVGYSPIYQAPKKPPAVQPLRPKSCMPKIQNLENRPKPNIFNQTMTQVELPPKNPETPFRRSYLTPIDDLLECENDETETSPVGAPKKPLSSSSSSRSSGVRPKTAPLLRTSSHDNSGEKKRITEIFGSPKMEKLLKVMNLESLVGHLMERFVRETNNEIWLNALLFWIELQNYHKLFIDLYEVDLTSAKAHVNNLYVKYVMEKAPHDFGVDKATRAQILRNIDPPYEELFDKAEELALLILDDALGKMDNEASEKLSSVARTTVTRKIETKNAEILALNKMGVFKQASILPREEESMEDLTQLPFDEKFKQNWEAVPEEFRDWNLEMILYNRVEFENFRLFLENNNASMDLECWKDIESYRRLPPNSDSMMVAKAQDIKGKYLNKKYFFGSPSPASQKEQSDILERHGGWAKVMSTTPPPPLLTDVQSCVKRRLEGKWLPMFLATPEFGERQKPVPVNEDDEKAKRRRKASQVADMLEMNATAHDSLRLRNALSNPETRRLFHRFLKLRNQPGQFLPNDLYFYDEVQKYKQLYHMHAEDKLIQEKVIHIIQIFLNDHQRNPSLRIDINPDIAEKILEHRRELGPYLFRDAQFTVFRVLLKQWDTYQRFEQVIKEVKDKSTKTVRIAGTLYPVKANADESKLLPVDPQHFMECLEKRKLTVEKQRQLKESTDKKKNRDVRDDDLEDNEAIQPQETSTEMFNPFASAEQQQQQAPPKSIVWRYSDYQYALEREQLLNNTDETTFILDEVEFDKAVEFFPHLFEDNLQ